MSSKVLGIIVSLALVVTPTAFGYALGYPPSQPELVSMNITTAVLLGLNRLIA